MLSEFFRTTSRQIERRHIKWRTMRLLKGISWYISSESTAKCTAKLKSTLLFHLFDSHFLPTYKSTFSNNLQKTTSNQISKHHPLSPIFISPQIHHLHLLFTINHHKSIISTTRPPLHHTHHQSSLWSSQDLGKTKSLEPINYKEEELHHQFVISLYLLNFCICYGLS